MQFLAGNPKLQALKLDASLQCGLIDLASIFHLRLPLLKTFSFQGDLDTIPTSSLLEFFDDHSYLESIYIDGDLPLDDAPTPQAQNRLPNLKHLAIISDRLGIGLLEHMASQTDLRSLESLEITAPSADDRFMEILPMVAGNALSALCINFKLEEPEVNTPPGLVFGAWIFIHP
ncbi:hypothetical protein FRB90_008271 [Tulasnella sp. 427]|nr:hypothetical protein FRB90_008271 [Tulasnella sp. 427]